MQVNEIIKDIEGIEDPDTRKALLEHLIAEAGRRFEFEKIKLQKDLEAKFQRRTFWFGSAFVGLVSAVLTLAISSLAGYTNLQSKHHHEVELAAKKFERDQIAAIVSEKDGEAKIDALKLLIMSDVIEGLTLGELDTYRENLKGRPVPEFNTGFGSGTPPAKSKYEFDENDVLVQELIGSPGERSFRPGLVRVPTPFPFSTRWEPNAGIREIEFHRYGACALKRALEKTWKHYGENVHTLGISTLHRSYSPIKRSGSNRPSLHAWGLAIDLDSEGNPMIASGDASKFSGPKYAKLLDIFQTEGFVNMGRRNGTNWGHFGLDRDAIRRLEEPSLCGL